MVVPFLLSILLWAQAPTPPPGASPPAPLAAPSGTQNPPDSWEARALRLQTIRQDCTRLLATDASLAPLEPLCNSALAYSFTLPNFICQQRIDRRNSISTTGLLPPRDVITAQVTFQDGMEHYSNIALNGTPVHGGLLDLNGMDSVGEFG